MTVTYMDERDYADVLAWTGSKECSLKKRLPRNKGRKKRKPAQLPTPLPRTRFERLG